MTIVTLVIAIAAIIVAIIATVMVSRSMHKKAAANKVDSAENKAREIIDDAVKTAEAKKREALIEAKEDALKQKKELDKEINKAIRITETEEFQKKNTESMRKSLERLSVVLNQVNNSIEKSMQPISEMLSRVAEVISEMNPWRCEDEVDTSANNC